MKNRMFNLFLIMLILMLTGTSRLAMATILDSDVQLLNIDANNSLMYWFEGDPDSLKSQRSTNGGINWSAPTEIVSIPIGIDINDFDGIHSIGTAGRLIATFAVFKVSSNTAHLVVSVSDDYGLVWGSSDIVLSQRGGSYLGCPTLTTSYNPASNTISLHTTLITAPGRASIFYVSSSDGGNTWNPQQQLADVPATCFD